jgi:hypothetical protein
MTERMLQKLNLIFSKKYAFIQIQLGLKYALSTGCRDWPRDKIEEEWSKICSDAGVERRPFNPGGSIVSRIVVPEGFVEIIDASLRDAQGAYSGYLRMSEETAMKVLALGDIP